MKTWGEQIDEYQSEDRAQRRENVRITDLVVPNTIDTKIRNCVEKKREMAEAAEFAKNLRR